MIEKHKEDFYIRHLTVCYCCRTSQIQFDKIIDHLNKSEKQEEWPIHRDDFYYIAVGFDEFDETDKDHLKMRKEKVCFKTREEAENAIKEFIKTLHGEVDEDLNTIEENFKKFMKLHKNIVWEDVEKSLRADPESMKKLQALDAHGHNMTVFGEENGEYVFASAWTDYQQVSADHRNIPFDAKGQELAKEYGYTANGNAVDIAKLIGVDLADSSLHEQLRKVIGINGWAWLKTDAVTRKSGNAVYGNNYYDGIGTDDAYDYSDYGSFRAALRVKKA